MLYANKAAEIIRSQVEDSPPFFIYLSFLTKSYPRDNKVSTYQVLACWWRRQTQKIRQNVSVSGDSLMKAAKKLTSAAFSKDLKQYSTFLLQKQFKITF